MYLYHSSQPTDYVGTYLYNETVEELFPYAEYDPTNTLPLASYRPAAGLTNIAQALETGIDEIVDEHGEGGANGGHIFLMSDGRQTTGPDLWDQVTRATEIGIQIHTMAFGNADIPLMEMIATETSGTSVEVAEKEDADELKLVMARRFTTLRGYKPIFSHKGPLDNIESTKTGDIHVGKFNVPGKSANLLFYSFLDGGNSANYDIQLIGPDGSVVTRSADSIALRGRFNGLRIEKPIPGVWKYHILGAKKRDGTLPKDGEFELIAYAENRELSSSIRLDSKTSIDPKIKLIQAHVSHRYPLTGVDAHAYIYLGSDLIEKTSLYDDGKNGHDDQSHDGLYHGIIDVAKLDMANHDRKTKPKLRIDVHFNIGKTARPAPNAHYETGAEYYAVEKDYHHNVRNDFSFSAWSSALTAIDPPEVSDPTIQVVVPKGQQKVKPGYNGKLIFHVTGARPTIRQTRISLGEGVLAIVEDIEDKKETLGAVVTARYTVLKDAEHGPRDLKVQFANVILKSPELLFVGQKQKNRPPWGVFPIKSKH
jgi:hypothetical protein